MFADDELLNSPELDLDGWRDALLRKWGRYTPVARESESFTGRRVLEAYADSSE